MKIALWIGKTAATLLHPLRPARWGYREHFVDLLPAHHTPIILPYDDDPGDIAVDILEEWREPRPPRQKWPCE
jgi:hypothetical protein